MAFAAVLRARLLPVPTPLSSSSPPPFFAPSAYVRVPRLTAAAARTVRYRRRGGRPHRAAAAITASLDLTEDNVRVALDEAKSEARKLNRFPFSPHPPIGSKCRCRLAASS
uniref:Uncharacterized protein n=1 Tax=Zea mays TaxID=4577 RepID=A0A804MPA1_MAIZE